MDTPTRETKTKVFPTVKTNLTPITFLPVCFAKKRIATQKVKKLSEILALTHGHSDTRNKNNRLTELTNLRLNE